MQLMSVGLAKTISGTHNMGSQLLQNTDVIKQTEALLWKIWRIYGSVSYLFSCNEQPSDYSDLPTALQSQVAGIGSAEPVRFWWDHLMYIGPLGILVSPLANY